MVDKGVRRRGSVRTIDIVVVEVEEVDQRGMQLRILAGVLPSHALESCPTCYLECCLLPTTMPFYCRSDQRYQDDFNQ